MVFNFNLGKGSPSTVRDYLVVVLFAVLIFQLLPTAITLVISGINGIYNAFVDAGFTGGLVALLNPTSSTGMVGISLIIGAVILIVTFVLPASGGRK